MCHSRRPPARTGRTHAVFPDPCSARVPRRAGRSRPLTPGVALRSTATSSTPVHPHVAHRPSSRTAQDEGLEYHARRTLAGRRSRHVCSRGIRAEARRHHRHEDRRAEAEQEGREAGGQARGEGAGELARKTGRERQVGREVRREVEAQAGRRHVLRALVPFDRSRERFGPRRGPGRGSARSAHVVRGLGLRRRVENHERRHVVDAGVRRAGHVEHRLRDDRAVAPAHRVGGLGREQQPAERRLGGRRLPLGRRRPHVDQHGAQGERAHRPHRRSPHEPGRRVGGRARAAVGARRRPRRVQDDGRRQDVEAGYESG